MSTAVGPEVKSQLRRELNFWDVLFFNIATVLGPRWIAEERVTRGDDHDLGLEHAGTVPAPYRSHTRSGRAGGVRDGDTHLTRRTDPGRGERCDGLPMYAQYPAIWSAKLVPPTLSPSTESVSVIVRVVYNTLEGIINDFFVVTTTVSARNPR